MTAQSPAQPSSEADTIALRLVSGNGPVTRRILRTPPRNATPGEIPTIDVSAMVSPTSSVEDRMAVAKQIHAAATNTGFFYITNHGVPSSVTSAAYEGTLDFFRQAPEKKSKANADQSVYVNGWMPPRASRVNPFESVDLRESFSFAYDPRYDPAAPKWDTISEDIRETLKVEPDSENSDVRFPWTGTQSVPHMQPAIIAYWRSCLALARGLVHAFALSLGLPETFFDSKFSFPDAILALNYYPPILTPPASSSSLEENNNHSSSSSSHGDEGDDQAQVSIGSHTDFQLFTILWQDMAGGLQVLNRAGQWIYAPPIEGTLVVNMADYMQRITNDLYQSTVHRARNTSGRERVSMPFFFGFNPNESCGVLDCCVGADGVRRYEEVSCREWVNRRFKMMNDTTGETARERTGEKDKSSAQLGRPQQVAVS